MNGKLWEMKRICVLINKLFIVNEIQKNNYPKNENEERTVEYNNMSLNPFN